MDRLNRVLLSKKVEAEKLPAARVRKLQQDWLSRYLGKNAQDRFDEYFWDAFLNGSLPRGDRDEARNRYRAITAPDFFAIAPYWDGPGYVCNANSLPDLDGKDLDVLVFAPDLSWTMCYDHENFGPFFTTPDSALTDRK